MSEAVIYGLRPLSEVDRYFYVGSTKKAAVERLTEHLDQCRKGKHLNRHLQSTIRRISAENVTIDILETVALAERFDCEYAWIAKLRAQGQRLCNLQLTPKAHSKLSARQRKELEIIESFQNPEHVLSMVDDLLTGPGTAQIPEQQDILVKFHEIAIAYLKSLTDNHWEEFLSITHWDPSCETTNLIQTKIKALPSPSWTLTQAT